MPPDTAPQTISNAVGERVRCPSCEKSFARRTHMLRHAQKHHSQKPFSCRFCSKEFVRSDTLFGHYSSCEYRGGLPIPNHNALGRRKHACNECTRLKVRCDYGTPCLRCTRLKKECLRSQTQANTVETLDSNIFTGADLNANRNSIQFLLRDSGGANFAEWFPKSKENNDSLPIRNNWDGRQIQDSPLEGGFNQSPLPSSDLDFESLFESFDAQGAGHSFFHWPWVEFPDSSGQYQQGSIQSPPPNETPDALIPRSTEMKTQIYNAISKLNIPEYEPRLKATFEALEIVTPERVQAFAKLYFHHWHRHGPILHEPSFDPSKVALPLLLSVFAIGGMYSKDPLEVSMMKLLLDFIEIVVYSSIDIEDDYEIRQGVSMGENDDCNQQRKLEEFQGAYLMVVVQYWAGNAIAKKRVRQQRFMRLISVARSQLALTRTHEDNLTLSDSQGFRSWIRRECVVRTMNIMSTLDNAFGIFNNLPPRFTWSEVDWELPCESKYFEAANYEDMRDRSCFPERKIKVTEAFQLFFLRSSPQSERFDPVKKGSLNMWDLQILVHIFYTFIWRQLFDNPIATVLPATLNPFIASAKLALHNWKRVWDEVQYGIAPADLLAMGFPASAERYWLLTRFVIHSFENNKGKPSLPIKADVDDIGAHLKPAMSLIHN